MAGWVNKDEKGKKIGEEATYFSIPRQDFVPALAVNYPSFITKSLSSSTHGSRGRPFGRRRGDHPHSILASPPRGPKVENVRFGN